MALTRFRIRDFLSLVLYEISCLGEASRATGSRNLPLFGLRICVFAKDQMALLLSKPTSFSPDEVTLRA